MYWISNQRPLVKDKITSLTNANVCTNEEIVQLNCNLGFDCLEN